MAAVTWLAIFAASTVIGQVIISASGHGGQSLSELPFWVTVSTQLGLWVPTVIALWWVSKRHLTGSPRRDYALRFRPADLLGIPIGVLSQLVLLELLYWPLRRIFEKTFSPHEIEKPARDLLDRAAGGWRIVLVLILVVGAPLVEETLYRGLILRSLDARLADLLALVLSAVWFAGSHFQAVQFVGLFAFGVVLGACLQRTGRLGMGILAHASFNATSLLLLWPRH